MTPDAEHAPPVAEKESADSASDSFYLPAILQGMAHTFLNMIVSIKKLWQKRQFTVLNP